MQPQIVEPYRFLQRREKLPPVAVVAKCLAPFVASRGDVIHGSRKLDSNWAGHLSDRQ
jgi:hypothetical protein